MSQETDWLEVLPEDRLITVSEWVDLIRKHLPEYQNKHNLSMQLHSMCNHSISSKMEIIRRRERGNPHKLVRRLKKDEVTESAFEQISLDLPKWMCDFLQKRSKRYGTQIENQILHIVGSFIEQREISEQNMREHQQRLFMRPKIKTP